MSTTNENIICEVCGGNEFTVDAGYYYCTECQTQTHELREHELEVDETVIGTKTTKTTITRSEGDTKSNSGVTSTSKKGPKLTSWEVFNFVLAGVVNEMIGLGGTVELCDVTKNVWFYYLRKLNILRDVDDHRRPLLGLGSRKNDAMIVYGVRYKSKRKKSLASSSSLSDIKDDKLMSRERRKRRRAMVQADYETKQQGIIDANKTLKNTTLSELQSSDSDSASVVSANPKYNRKARLCINSAKYKRRIRQMNYRSTPYHLTRDRMYSIASLSCLICSEDKWMPADIVRACQQGHISYLDYAHMLPSDVNATDVIPSMRGPKVCLTHRTLRKGVKLIADLLKININNFQPDLCGLISRYCTELNLPDEIKNMAINLVNEVPPKFQNKNSDFIPNFEGRSISYILYVLKLLFGVDNKTEFIQSQFASDINSKNDENMFVFETWINFLQLRKLILKNFHFPFNIFENENTNLKLFVSFLQQQKENFDDNNEDLRKQVLEKCLKDLEIYEGRNLLYTFNFEHNVRLFWSYIETIKSQNLKIDDQNIPEIIFQKFYDQKLDYLFHHKKFLKDLHGDNYSVLRRGAHENSVFVNLVHTKPENLSRDTYEKWLESFENNKLDNFFTSELENFVLHRKLKPKTQTVMKQNQILVEQILENKNNKDRVGRDKSGRFCKKDSPNARTDENYHIRRKRGQYFLSSWTDNPKLRENIHNSLYADIGGEPLLEFGKRVISEKIAPQKRPLNYSKNDFLYFLPHNEYWIFGTVEIIKDWRKIKSMLPRSFYFLLEEFSKVCGQTPRCLFEEFFLLETYLNFEHFKYPVNSVELKKNLRYIHRNW